MYGDESISIRSFESYIKSIEIEKFIIFNQIHPRKQRIHNLSMMLQIALKIYTYLIESA